MQRILAVCILICLASSGFAHDIETMEQWPRAQVATHFIEVGFLHVIPLGFDHILFMLGIFFSAHRFKDSLIQSWIFTVAHSLALLIASVGFKLNDLYIVEILIGLSIVTIGLEPLLFKDGFRYSKTIIFLFGVIHGLGFSSALQSYGMPDANFLPALFSFNIGIEIAQVMILLILTLLTYYISNRPWYRLKVVVPVSLLIVVSGVLICLERI